MWIHVDRDLCIGAAPCVAVASDVFKLDDEGKAVVIEPAETNEKGWVKVKEGTSDEATIKMAAESCPVKAIFLYDDDGKQLFPEN